MNRWFIRNRFVLSSKWKSVLNYDIVSRSLAVDVTFGQSISTFVTDFIVMSRNFDITNKVEASLELINFFDKSLMFNRLAWRWILWFYSVKVIPIISNHLSATRRMAHAGRIKIIHASRIEPNSICSCIVSPIRSVNPNGFYWITGISTDFNSSPSSDKNFIIKYNNNSSFTRG